MNESLQLPPMPLTSCVLHTPLTSSPPPPHTTYTHTQRPFDGAAFAAAGTAYAMGATDAAAYARPYEDAAASAAIAATMDALDFPALLREVDDGFQRWRKPSVLLFGGPYDPWLNAKSAFEFLDSKRTNMRLVTASAKVRTSGTHSGARRALGRARVQQHMAAPPALGG